MKNKATLFMLALAGAASFTSAVAQNAECVEKISIFHESVKAKNYDGAYAPWQMVYNTCPEMSAATFVDGEKILKHKLKTATAAEKTALIAELNTLFDKSNQYFPKKFTLAEINTDKAILKYDQKVGTKQEIYDLLDAGFKQDAKNFDNPKAMYLYFSSLVDLHKSGVKDLQNVFDTYDDVTELIEIQNKKLTNIIAKYLPKKEANTLTSKEKRKLRRANKNSEAFAKVQGSVDGKLGKLADCENLIPLYQKNFEQKKTDAVWLKRAAGRMDSKDCADDPLFVTLVEALHQLEPSAKSAYYLGYLNDKKGKSSEALKYYNESVDLEQDTYEKAKTLYKIAAKYKKRGQKSTARSYAQKALKYQPTMGKAYLLISNLYASSANQCGTTTFNKKAMYWKAAEMARKAASVDPTVRAIAKKMAASHAQRAPSKTEIFSAGMAGKTVTFGCWVGGSVRVPNL